MLSTQLARAATVATTAWLVFGNAPFSQETSLTIAGGLLLVVVVDLLDLLPSMTGESA